MTTLSTIFLQALHVLSVGVVPTTAAASEMNPWAIVTAIAAVSGSVFASKKAMRKALRKAAWQHLWQARDKKLSIESPEFLLMAIIIGAVGLLAAIFGLVLLAGITLGCAVLCLIRSFF